MKSAILTLLFALLLSSHSDAHQAFRVLRQGSLPVLSDQPVLEPTPIYQSGKCSVYPQEGSNNRFYSVPSRLHPVQSRSDSLFGASLESERQDHIIIIIAHGILQSELHDCEQEFLKSRGSADATISLYPAELSDVSLIGDPQDHLVLKFYYASTAGDQISRQLQVLTILQSSSRKNVKVIKKLLALQLDAVAILKIKVRNSSGAEVYKLLTIPMTLGSIRISSQGL